MQGPPQISSRTPGQRRIWLRRAPVLALLVAALLGALFFRDVLDVEALARHREALLAFRDAHYLASVAAFLAAYVAIVALSLPGGTVATLAGGFLFGLFPGVLLNVTAATLGATLLFLAARSGLGDSFASRLARDGGRTAGLIAAIRQNEWSVLLMMRLVPAVPFFLANLIPAFTGTRLPTYVATTFLGIIPAAFVFTSVGAGLGEVFAQGGRPDLALIFSPPVLLPLLGLAALAALPMVLRAFRKGA